MAQRTCITCAEVFTPSSGHRACPKCRRRTDKKNKCICGDSKQKESKTCVNCTDQSNVRNPNWKGGQSLHKKGYVIERACDHPRAKSNNGYVFKHILVMEKKLGRYLLAGETIHHKNGVKDDNRIGNLELWTRPQPSGIRVKDAVKWAKDILKRYRAKTWAIV